MDRYGEAIEADLHRQYGLDLIDFFRGTYSWRKLIALLGQLPRTSSYREAKADDDEAAAQYVAQLGDKPESSARRLLSEFTPETELLTVVVELLQAVNGSIAALGGGKPRPITSLPRPVTAVDRALRKAATDRLTELISEVEQAQQRWEETRP